MWRDLQGGRASRSLSLPATFSVVSCLLFGPPGPVLPLASRFSVGRVPACASLHARPALPSSSVSSQLHCLFSSTSCPPAGCLPIPQPLSRTCCLLSPPSPLTLTLSPTPLPLLRTAPPVKPPPSPPVLPPQPRPRPTQTLCPPARPPLPRGPEWPPPPCPQPQPPRWPPSLT